MPWPLPIYGTQVQPRRNAAGTNVPTVNVTAGAAHVDGAIAEVVASAEFDAWVLDLFFGASAVANTNTTALMDILIGPAGSEVELIADIMVGYVPTGAGASAYKRMWAPLFVPAGSRLSARVRSAVASKVYSLGIQLIGGGGPWSHLPIHCVKSRTVGAVPASSKGTPLATPGAAHAKGAWTVLEASVAEEARAIGWGVGLDADASAVNVNAFMDIGVGAAGAEQVIVPDIYFQSSSSEDVSRIDPLGGFWWLESPIPVGQRIVARYQGSVTTQPFDLVLHLYS